MLKGGPARADGQGMAKARARLIGAVATLGSVAITVSLLAGPASADQTVAQAKAQAASIAAQVQALETQAEAASEDYDGIQEKLASVVTQYLTLSQQADQLGESSQAMQDDQIDRIRDLYRAGGQLGLYATVLDGSDINDVLNRYDSVQRVMSADASSVLTADGRVAAAGRQLAALNTLATKRAQLESQAAVDKARVIGLLSERQATLAAANQNVLRLVAQAQAAAAAAAAARAAAVVMIDPNAPTTVPPGTSAVVAAAITAARTRLGDPYIWATGPSTFDCSGLTGWAYAQAGVHLPRTSREQWFTGPHPALADLQPGDLLFYSNSPTDPAAIHHVTLYIGGGYMIEAPHTGGVVQITKVYLDGYFGATRPTAS